MKSKKNASLKSDFSLSKRSSRRSTQCENSKLEFLTEVTVVPRTDNPWMIFSWQSYSKSITKYHH